VVTTTAVGTSTSSYQDAECLKPPSSRAPRGIAHAPVSAELNASPTSALDVRGRLVPANVGVWGWVGLGGGGGGGGWGVAASLPTRRNAMARQRKHDAFSIVKNALRFVFLRVSCARVAAQETSPATRSGCRCQSAARSRPPSSTDDHSPVDAEGVEARRGGPAPGVVNPEGRRGCCLLVFGLVGGCVFWVWWGWGVGGGFVWCVVCWVGRSRRSGTGGSYSGGRASAVERDDDVVRGTAGRTWPHQTSLCGAAQRVAQGRPSA